ncbi:MAG: WecB/TagA/CpsF family glycosyltransferase, partial [Myxococcota bacterium]
TDIVTLFDLPVFSRNHERAMQQILRYVETKQKALVYFVNAHTVNTAKQRPDFLEVLQGADLLLPDGIGLELAARMKGSCFEENLCGTDFIEYLCVAELKLYLLGGTPGTAERAGEVFHKRWGGQIVGVHHGFILNRLEMEQAVCEDIRACQPDVVLVGFGVPLQEEWCARFRTQLDCPILMGVGGLFDYYSGNVKRAPLLWRKARIEWVYRLMQEPGRLWKRYLLGNVEFLWHSWRDRGS